MLKKIPKILVFPRTTKLHDAIVRAWFKIAKNSIQKKGWFAVALCGGKTPESFYRYLSKRRRNSLWQHTYIFMTDERFVRSSHKENNGKMIKENLLEQVEISEQNIHCIDTDKRTVRSSANGYENEIKAFFRLKDNSLPKFDLILLGVGEDGHTASLFPPIKTADKSEKRAVVYSLNPSGTQWRISLSLPVINNARNVFFLVTGRKKAKVMQKIFSGKAGQLPAAQVEPRRGEVTVFLDYSAGFLVNA